MTRTKLGTALLTGAMLTGPLASAATAAPNPDDVFKTPGNSVDILGHPQIASATTTSVRIRYRCTTDLIGQLGVRVAGSVIHSNRWARFQYPFTAANCDGQMHVTTIDVSTYPPANTTATMVPGERVTVGVDLLGYEPPTAHAPGPHTRLAGQRQVDVRIR